jgi:hypothetical protein
MVEDAIRRHLASRGGATAMFFIYFTLIAVLDFMGYLYFEMHSMLGRILVPASLFMDVNPADMSWIGVSTLAILVSGVIYTVLGYVIDRLYKPYQ